MASGSFNFARIGFFAKGPVLELGCLQGASTIVLYRANRNVTTIDISMEAIEAARANFKRHNVKPTIIHADAAAGIKQLAKEGKKFAFVFVDHDHGYDSVYRACVELPSVLQEGAYLFFHDFQDLRNESGIFGVYKAVKDTLADKLDFIGLSGNGAVFRYIAA
jgi:SAM-dependent methyltransferase